MAEPLRGFGSEMLIITQMKMHLMQEHPEWTSDQAEAQALQDYRSGQFLQDPYTALDAQLKEDT